MVALGFAAAHASCRGRTFPASLPCNASALSAPYHGPLKVVSVASFGCEGGFAYLWATVGKGEEEIGVTEVLAYDQWCLGERVAGHLLRAASLARLRAVLGLQLELTRALR